MLQLVSIIPVVQLKDCIWYGQYLLPFLTNLKTISYQNKKKPTNQFILAKIIYITLWHRSYDMQCLAVRLEFPH